jgi:ferredoxin-NADP reductase/ferredoxin
MPEILYNNVSYQIPAGVSLLEGLEQQGVAIASSCRSGPCQTCKKKLLQGNVPTDAQRGLKPTEQAQGYFLPCVCYPTENIVIADIDFADTFPSQILSIKALNAEVAEIKLKCPENFQYQPGQYIQLFKNNTLCRNYSLASQPELEPLTLHVKKVIGGEVSAWLHELAEGYELRISSPLGNCFYQPSTQKQPILMLGTGSGLAPLYGILKSALKANHQEDIWLFHGVNDPSQLYFQDQLQALAEQYPQLHYIPCVAEGALAGCEQGMIVDIALKKLPSLKNFMVYLSGAPEMVKQASLKSFLAGASMRDIYKDPFG